MTWYELWLFLHISAVVLWVGGAVAVQVFGALATSSGDPARSAAFGKDTGAMVRWVFMPSSLVVLVTLTTPWTKLLAGLRGLAVPKIFILIIGMAYRYIFLLLNSVTDMYTARKARAVGNQREDVKSGQRFVTATAGALFGKAHALSEEVHMAMVSRGYTGDATSLQAPSVGARDVVFLVGVVAAAVLTVGGDRLLGR
jgi:energy-coupling factor transporter transmembrane protein EcfT